VTFSPLPVVGVGEELVPLIEPNVPPALNCSRSACSVANAVCALEKFPSCSAVESEFSACET
jgi:hypothetical protein